MNTLHLAIVTCTLLLSTACTQSKRHSPSTGTGATNLNQPSSRNTTISENPRVDFLEREKAIESIEQLLRDMECQISDTNLACPIPENQAKSNDLANVLKSYDQVLILQIPSSNLSNEKRAAYKIRQAPISGYLAELNYNSRRLFSRDRSQIFEANERLEALEIRYVPSGNVKTRDGISDVKGNWVVPSSTYAYNTPIQILKVINNYIETVAWFLNIYSNNSQLSGLEREGYLQKVAQLEELAVRVQKIGSRN